MARSVLNVLAVFVAIAGGLYQLYFKPILTELGVGRVVESINNKNCISIPELQACEKVEIYQPTGLVYLTCSQPSSRVHWIPATNRLNASGASRTDYIATYDPKTSRVTRLTFPNFDSIRGYSSHGMSVVPSSSDPHELFVYLVNHRAPIDKSAFDVGADSSIEIFKARVGGRTLVHIKTVEDPIISTPNDVVGSADGKSFYFTNDHGANKVGLVRNLALLGYAMTSVGYCHIDEGCKLAIDKMHGNNGIAKAPNGTFYVANALSGAIRVLEPQNDHTLVLTDTIKMPYPVDNLSVDAEGHLWAAGIIEGLKMVYKHFADPSVHAGSSALRISINTGPNAFFGEKYKVDKVFEDDGHVASGSTSVAYDTQRKKLYLHGIVAPHFTVCSL